MEKKKILIGVVTLVVLVIGFIIVQREEQSYGKFIQENYPDDVVYENQIKLDEIEDGYLSIAYVINDENQVKNILVSITDERGYDISKSNDPVITKYKSDADMIQEAMLAEESIDYGQLQAISEEQVNTLIDGLVLPSGITMAIKSE